MAYYNIKGYILESYNGTEVFFSILISKKKKSFVKFFYRLLCIIDKGYELISTALDGI